MNSELKGEDSWTPNTELGDITIGRTLQNENLNGKIYSVRVYNRGLSDEEIKRNFEVDRKRFGIIE